MRVYSRTLNVRKFEKDFSSLIRLRDDKDTVIKDVIERVNAAKADIVTFLKNVDEIEDEKVQKSCRRAAIAQMYHVNTESRGGYPHIATQSKWALLVQFKQVVVELPIYSSAIVSKYGDLITGEGTIYVNPMTNYRSGWIFRELDGGKQGFISDYGDVLIPCLFDSCTNTDDGIAYRFYKGVAFELTVYGKQGEIDNKWIKQMIDVCDLPDSLFCRSESGVLYTLKAEHAVLNPSNGEIIYNVKRSDGKCTSRVDRTIYQDAVKAVKAFMSPFIVSQEEQKRLLES